LLLESFRRGCLLTEESKQGCRYTINKW